MGAGAVPGTVAVVVVLVRIAELEHETKKRDAERTSATYPPRRGRSTGSVRRTHDGVIVIASARKRHGRVLLFLLGALEWKGSRMRLLIVSSA
jgi:hypothetical protein